MIINHPAKTNTEARVSQYNSSTENILEKLSEGACIIDSDYNITYINPALEKICGCPAGKCYQHFFRQNDVCPWCNRFENRSEWATEWKSSYTCHGRTYEYTDTLMADSSGQRCILRIFHDVTEHIRTAEEYMDYKHQIHDVLSEYEVQSGKSFKLLLEKLNS